MLEALLTAGLVGAVQGLVIWGGLRVELRYLRRDIDAAHRRLDIAGAPGAWKFSKESNSSRS